MQNALSYQKFAVSSMQQIPLKLDKILTNNINYVQILPQNHQFGSGRSLQKTNTEIVLGRE